MKFSKLFETTLDETKWHEYTFVMPTVSIGNVGQLAIDLIIASLQAKLVGYITSDCVIPVVGMDAFDENSSNLTTSLDVFESCDKKLVILQQRAPHIKGRQTRFTNELVEWIVEKQFKNVVILTSVLACERVDSQLVGTQCRYIVSKAANSILDENVISLTVPKLEKRNSEVDSFESDSEIYIPGSGIAKRLFQNLQSKDKDVIVLLRFCYEADNTFDAADLAMSCNNIFSWIPPQEKWKSPPSWKCLYGRNPDQLIYQ